MFRDSSLILDDEIYFLGLGMPGLHSTQHGIHICRECVVVRFIPFYSSGYSEQLVRREDLSKQAAIEFDSYRVQASHRSNDARRFIETVIRCQLRQPVLCTELLTPNFGNV